MDVVEAAHIAPYRGTAEHAPANGLLLRADLHTLFDLDLLGIEPDSLTVRLAPQACASGYEAFDGARLCLGNSVRGPSRKALKRRWEAFRRKRGEEGPVSASR